MGARSAMAARIGTSRGDGGGVVGEWALWRLRLGDHGDWSGIASLHGQAESMLGMVTFQDRGSSVRDGRVTNLA